MTDVLSHKISPKKMPDGTTRHIIMRRKGNRPSRIAGLYENHLHRTKNSPNTIINNLWGIIDLLSWGDESGLDVETRLLQGHPLPPMEIQSFSHWLMNKSTKTETIANKKNHNHKIAAVRSIERWFVEMYYQKSDPAQRAIETAQIIEAQAGIWKRMARKTNHKPEATDLTNDEISEIETYLRGQGIGENSTPIGARRYLMWRLAIEFGFRIGEILALRNEDCPSRTKTSFSIVRIEDRKNDADPRGINAPRPKTLGRDLGILFTNSVFPHLVSTFQSEHRHGWKISRKGIRIKDWVLPHPYLITDTEGNPLSVRGASKDAAAISEATGVEFTWHKARHAFFNRAYASIADIEDINVHNARIMDLVYWGGWNDPGSLSIYSRKARKDRAQSTFIFWQNGGTRWNELG